MSNGIVRDGKAEMVADRPVNLWQGPGCHHKRSGFGPGQAESAAAWTELQRVPQEPHRLPLVLYGLKINRSEYGILAQLKLRPLRGAMASMLCARLSDFRGSHNGINDKTEWVNVNCYLLSCTGRFSSFFCSCLC